MSSRKHLTEQERAKNERIVEGFRSNHQKIIKACYQEAYPYIVRLVDNNGGNRSDARSLLHDGLLVFHTKCNKPDFELTAKFTSYIYGVCRLLWLQELASRKKDILGYLQIFSDAPLDEVDEVGELSHFIEEQQIEGNLYAQQLILLMYQFLEDSNKQCRSVVSLYASGKSHREIAQNLRISEDVSRKTLSRCRKHLAQKIKESTHFQELISDSSIKMFLKKYLKHFVYLLFLI